MIVESLQNAILMTPDCSNENFHPVPQLSDSEPCFSRPKRVTFAAELNLRRRSARQSLLGLTVDEIDALGRLDGGGVQRPLTTVEALTKQPIVGILRKKEYSMEQLNMELEIMRNTCIDETLDCQNNQRLLQELELYIASFKEPTKQQNQIVNCKARQLLQESLKDLKKKERKYDRKIVILQQTTNKVRVLNKNFRREISNICAPLKKA